MEQTDAQVKRILLITDVATHPQNRGNSRRVFDLVELMKELGYEVHCLLCNARDVDRKRMREYFKGHLYDVKAESPKGMAYTRHFLRSEITKGNWWKYVTLHYQMDELYSDAIGRKAMRLHQNYHYDVVWLEYVKYSKVLDCFDREVLKVIDTHDIFAYREKMFLEQGVRPEMYYMTKRQEKMGLARADAVIAIQDREEEYFKDLFHQDKTVVTIGDKRKIYEGVVPSHKNLLFVGTDYQPNVTALKWFINGVMPGLIQQDPQIRLYVAGKVCNLIDDHTHVEKLGYVEDLAQLYRNSRVVINPVSSGTGLNIKSIEALAHLRPLVTTTLGAKGIHASETIMLLADDEKTFEKQILRLLTDQTLYQQMRNNIRIYMNQYNADCLEHMRQVLTIQKEGGKS